MSYTPLHVHSIFSNLDGLSKVEDIVDRCIEIGAHGVCISDHAFATSHYDLSTLCEKKGIKPIFAVEGYLAPSDNTKHEKIEGFKDYYHITMIAKTHIGYKNLMRLIADSFMNGKYRKARTSLEQLELNKEGIIVLTACLGGFPSQMLSAGRDEEAYNWCRIMKEIFGKENFFIELTNTNLEEQFIVNRKLVKLAEDLDLDVIITPDSHYTKKTDWDYHRAMVCININRPFIPTGKEKEGDDVDEGSMFYTPGEYFLKSKDDLIKYYEEFPNIEEYFNNTNKIADSIEWIHLDKEKKFPCEFKDPNQELLNRVFLALKSKIESGILAEEHRDIYTSRIKEELDTIIKMGFSDYFIEIQNIVKWANDNGITTGPGRGCFHEDAPIWRNGGLKSIKDIVPGDMLMSSDFTLQRVIANVRYEIEEALTCISYKHFDNIFYRVYSTCDHKHLVIAKASTPVAEEYYPTDMKPFFLEACKIDPLFHALVTSDGSSRDPSYQKIIISDVHEIKSGKYFVHDLMMEGNNTFMIANHFVHNSGAGSFLNFLLDITRVNPLDYGLLFARRYCVR